MRHSSEKAPNATTKTTEVELWSGSKTAPYEWLFTLHYVSLLYFTSNNDEINGLCGDDVMMMMIIMITNTTIMFRTTTTTMMMIFL